MSSRRKAPAATSSPQNAPEVENEAPKRNPDGTFAKGNSGGPGNPFARKSAEFRKAFLEGISAEQFSGLVQIVLTRACQGDSACLKILLQYLIGKPAPAVNPDSLDGHEWQT